MDKTNVVQSFLYEVDNSENKLQQEMKVKPVAPIKKADIVLKQKIVHQQVAVVQHVSAPAQPQRVAGDGAPIPELVARLHAAIQQKQKYPDNALEMEREGKVTVVFLLNVDGTVAHLHIIKSSGTDSLDTAALAAVNEAAPFQSVNKYLHSPQEYTIDVVFQLT